MTRNRQYASSLILLLIFGVGFESQAISPVQMAQNTIGGLVAGYSFSEGTGTTVADASGNNNFLTLTNATWTASGHTGQGLTFNGGSTTARVTGTNTIPLSNNQLAMTVWVYPTQDPGSGEVVLISYYTTSQFSFGLIAFDYSASTGKPSCYISSTTTTKIVIGAAKLPLNTWTHLGCSYDKTNLTLYVNGALVGTTPSTISIGAAGSKLYLGYDPPDDTLKGTLDDVRIFNRALSGAEVQTLMDTPVAP